MLMFKSEQAYYIKIQSDPISDSISDKAVKVLGLTIPSPPTLFICPTAFSLKQV